MKLVVLQLLALLVLLFIIFERYAESMLRKWRKTMDEINAAFEAGWQSYILGPFDASRANWYNIEIPLFTATACRTQILEDANGSDYYIKVTRSGH
jgi:hypothetical protein